MSKINIKQDDLSGGEVIALLEEHLADMYATSPPESVHALDVQALKAPSITFFSAWIDSALAGCVALKTLSESEVELKSMRTVKTFKNRGVASDLLLFICQFAKQNGFIKISLETGTQDYFEAARQLYKKFGFQQCAPFSNYKLDPNSYFMSKVLSE
jgi:putative acetyltransferase